MSRRKKIPGITVWQPARKGTRTWSYQIELEPDPLTGERRRPSKGGFETYDAAMTAAIEAKRRHETGQAAHAKRMRVKDYLKQWHDATAPSLKPSAAQNDLDYINGYIVPVLGDRWLGDLTVPTINAFYKHLGEAGRRKVDTNSRMYEFWAARKDERNGLGPNPRLMAERFGVTLQGAQAAARRYRRGRVPAQTSAGLAPKTIRNIHGVMHRALADAVRWGYLYANPAEHAIVPRNKKRKRSPDEVWTVPQLVQWLEVALRDRYAGMWLLAANTGMRRSELAGVERSMLDLESGTLRLEDTRVVVAGKAQASDGKTVAGERDVSLDAFTIEWLRRFLAVTDEEREALGDEYPDHPYVMVGPEGRPLHPDTITARFNRLVDQAGVPRIRLHDVRHTYATLALNEGLGGKILSDRIGHAHPGITHVIYTHRSNGQDRPIAEHMGSLIRSALLAKNPALATDLATDSPSDDENDPESDPPDKADDGSAA